VYFNCTGTGQTISAPYMHAHVLEIILAPLNQILESCNPPTTIKILDVGCGSGYLTTAFARLVPLLTNQPYHVYGIDVTSELSKLSFINIQKQDADLIDSKKMSVRVQDGWEGLESEAPFHIIHVGASTETPPVELMMQLAVNGCMVIPVHDSPNSYYQHLMKVHRKKDSEKYCENDFIIDKLQVVNYVPLIRRQDFDFKRRIN